MVGVFMKFQRDFSEYCLKNIPVYRQNIYLMKIPYVGWPGKWCSLRKKYIYSLLYTPKHATLMMEIMFPVLNTYAAHCKGKTRGTRFAIYCSDDNRRQVLLSLMLVADNEKFKTCSSFSDRVRRNECAN